jgi:nucleoid-associated protein
MSANVKQFVVHQITLTEEGKLSFVPRPNCFEVSDAIVNLASQLHSQFSAKPSKGVGGFGELADPTMRNLVDGFNNQELDFYSLSITASERLLSAITDEAMLETGYVIFSLYEYLATDYLMIAMVDTKELVTVNSNLDLSENRFLELSKMQIAVRIDLTQYDVQSEDFRYISFIKGRMGRKVSDFFMNFIGCEEKVDTKAQNKQFVQQLDTYLAAQPLDATEKHQHRETVAKYYKDKASLGEDIHINEVDSILPKMSEHDHSFASYNANLEQPLEPKFQADKSMLNAMNKFSGAGGGLSISFDRKLLGERVQYNPHTDTLTIVGLPPNLKDQLSKTKPDGASVGALQSDSAAFEQGEED